MRWWSIPILVALGWFAFTLTPLWALYDLARAVQAHDTDYIARHVNFRTLRLSVIRQAAAAAQARDPSAPDVEPRERQRISEAAAALAIPIAEALVTPAMVVDLLDDGWPQSVELGREAPASKSGGGGLRIESLRRLIPFYLASEMRGFRTVVVGVPPEASRDRRLRIRLRLRAWTWRVVDIELNNELRERIAQTFARANAKGR
ncbi:DUF2939 domain-containing protein [Methylobacterium sp. J-068]|uniref:DUF2939 domain-containing protein n=1 Tax=Methylobacterium sp. J-068 TaxID=2836649 RepID=UPI001FB97855|nr:DUF2939 domain-containing protein [Methylobacterium sp. J-068]MCJ2036688.1 DUF2939 domain-containing protein [Methylobacterium sp. J-068]